MRVIQNKLLGLVISSILISTLIFIMIAYVGFSRLIEEDSKVIMQHMCSENKQKIDEKLLNIEQSVHTIYHFAVEQIENAENLWENETEFNAHLSRMKELMKISAPYTDGAVTVYYRLNPELRGVQQGLWLVQNDKGEFEEFEMTNVYQYDKDDYAMVGWYYIPVQNGCETWLNPYYNQRVDMEMISFVIPIIHEEQVIGVVGMDISTELLQESTQNVSVYNEGYAFLIDNEGKFVYHPGMQEDTNIMDFDSNYSELYEISLQAAEKQKVEKYQWNGMAKRLTAQKLRNEMIFSLSVLEEELRKPKQYLLLQIMAVLLLIMSVFVFITVTQTKAIVSLIYTDALTRVGNKSAYRECVDTLYKRIKNRENVHFAVVVADINDLKKVNDNYGHEYGDILIQSAASILKKVWGSKVTYRIGGDEFAVVLLDVDSETVTKDILMLEAEIEEFNCQNSTEKWCLQVAVGMAVYNPETDREYKDVFRRADSAMYEDKNKRKQ